MGIEGSCDGDGPKPNRIRVFLGIFLALRTVLLRQPRRAHGKDLKQQFSKAGSQTSSTRHLRTY